uniref:Probable caffeine synthase 3 n=1 Tax=Nicotiana sylvestris TaxID=4096 RepID=A0A1U7WIF8_NICSY|nr:PREDICTED: probable caffeine synthase 3 [Nicotiana sylvestris]
MAVERNINSSHEFPMASGASPFSYKKNSAYQRRVVRAIKQLVNVVVAEKLQVESLNIRGIFQITDMGCSTGPNTFISVQNIVESVELKFQQKKTNDTEIPKTQVFFSDHSFNDFNTLFASLPTNKSYYAAAAVGSFYDRVFPMNLFILLTALMVYIFCPKFQVRLKTKLHLLGTKEKFTIPMLKKRNPTSATIYNNNDNNNKPSGEIEEDEVDAFNIPVYSTSPSEIEEAITRNGCFDIEKLEILPKETSPINGLTAKDASVHIRAITEGLIEEKCGPKILDKLFHLYTQKLEDAYLDLLSGEAISLFVNKTLEAFVSQLPVTPPTPTPNNNTLENLRSGLANSGSGGIPSESREGKPGSSVNIILLRILREMQAEDKLIPKAHTLSGIDNSSVVTKGR